MDAQTEPEPELIRLELVFDPQKQQIAVNGPIMNRMLCYGLLKLAEKAIDENYAQHTKPRLVPANGQRRF
jgi:hypothetical protein